MADHAAKTPLKKRLLTIGALATSALLMGLGVTQVVGASANAAGSAFSCDENTLYAINGSGAFESIAANSGAATVLPSQSPSNNALGITEGGALAYSTLNTTTANANGTILEYNPVSGTNTSYTAYVPANAYRGAVDPSTGIYYYAQGNTTTAAIYAFNTRTKQAIGQVGVLDLNQSSTGDFAFSTTGVLYVVSGNEVDRVNGSIPTTAQTTAFSVTKIAQLGSVTASPGIAFSTSGYLYVAVNGTILQINPATGATVATQTITDGSGKTFTPTDLASCNYSDSIQAQASVDQRWKSSDQFTLTIGGGPTYGNTATTSGTTPGLQTATAGSNLVAAGSSYTVTQTGASGTDLSNYATTWECKSASGGYDVTGTGDTATVTPPTTSDNDISCLFTNKLTAVHVDGADDTYYTPTNTQLTQAAPGVLANDASATGRTITAHTQPSNGTLDTFDSMTGAFSYTPAGGFSGPDTFTYTTQDSSGQSQTNTVTINVGPLAKDDSGTVVVGGTLTVDAAHGVLSNDTGANLTASNASTPAHGTVSLSRDGSYVYTSTDSFSGTDTWTYDVTDGGGHTQTGTVTETITPKAVPDTLPATQADAAETVPSTSLLSNDVGSTVTVASVSSSSTQGGTVSLSSDGSQVTYTPAADFSGVDTFTYTIVDQYGNTGTATESVTVDPIAKPDALQALQQGDVATIPFSTLLGNDRGSNLTITGVSNANRGTVTIDQTAQTVTFTPTAGTSGNASFSYTISDGTDSSTTSVAVPVYPAPGDHTTTAVSGQADAVDAADGVLAGAQGSNLTAGGASTPHHGSVTLNSDGSYTYTPVASYSGPDAFTYTITDGDGNTTTGKVTITVKPLAQDDSIADTGAGAAETVPATALTGNDDGAHLSISSVGTRAAGTAVGGDATLNGSGTVTFTPADGFSGPASFQYTITDGTNTSTATVTLQVTPTAVDDTLPGTTAGASVTLPKSDFVGNDLGSGLEIVSVSGASLGDVTLNGDQSITYTAQAGFSGTYTFSYTIEDSAHQQSTATATIGVAPTAGALAISATAGTPDSVDAGHGLLSKDSGAGGSDLTVALSTDPGHTASHGTVSLGTGGAFTYTPADGFSGTDTFDYVVTDGSGTKSTGTVTVTVSPNAADFGTTTAAGSSVTLSPAGILKHADGSGLTVTVAQPADGGSITTDADGDYVYTPADGFSGADTFTYTVTDSSNHTSTGTITVQVTPVAKNDEATTTVGQTLTVDALHGVLANDEGTTLVPAVTTQPLHGTLTIDGDGSYSYVPRGTWSGIDSFTYTVTDKTGQTDTATVTIDVTPVAHDVTTTVVAGAAAHLDAPGVLADASGSGLKVTAVDGSGAPGAKVTTPGGNTVTVGTDGTFDFTPSAGYSGVDTIPVTIIDSSGLTTIGHVVVTVDPKASNDSYQTPAGTAVAIPLTTAGRSGLLDNDLGTGLTVTSATKPSVSHGTLVKQSDGSYVYTPDSGFSGTDRFGYTVVDSSNLTAAAIVTIIVGDQAADYTAKVAAGSPDSVSAADGLLKNASGSNLVPTLDQAPQHGTVTIHPDGSYTYTPAAGFSGTDSFTYRVTDGSGQVSTGQVTITVTPTATDDTEKVATGGTLTLTAPGVLGNDSGTALIVTAVGTPSMGGSATISGAGRLVYTPKPGFSGTETIPYTVTDQNGQTADATVTVDVTPVASNDAEQTIAGHSLSVSAANGLLSNDSGSGLVAAVVTAPKHGRVTVHPDGSYTYTPDRGFAGRDTFVYTATDSSGQVTTATATIDVLAGAVAKDITEQGKPGTKLTLSPLDNDTPTAGANWDPSTLQLIDPSTGRAVNEFSIPGKGTFAVVAGQVTFSPVHAFAGRASIDYQVSDSDDQLVTATITVIYPKAAAAAAAGDPAPAAHTGGAGTTPGSLAFTGSQGVGGMVMIGFGGLLLGLALVLMRRFRREAPGPRRTGL